MGSLLKLKSLLSIALGLFALQAVVTPAHSIRHLSWTRSSTGVFQPAAAPAADSDHACAICVAGASLSASLGTAVPTSWVPDLNGRFVTPLELLAPPVCSFLPSARAPPALLS